MAEVAALARIEEIGGQMTTHEVSDVGSAELTRHPDALASALKKIEMEFAPTRSMKRGTAHLCIADPLGRKYGFREGFWADLLATHPPMANRISRLLRMPQENSEQ